MMFFSRLRARLRIFCLKNVLIFRILTALFPRWRRLLTVNADICIDGFPRSGNSFFFALFRTCYPRIKVSHHTHSIANMFLCLKKGIPCFVLTRNPVDAITSFIIREESVSKEIFSDDYYYEYGLEYYKSFYESISRNKDNFIVIDFDEYITKPKGVLDIIIENTDLGLKSLSKKEVDKKAEESVKVIKERGKFKKVSDYSSCLPNELKDKRKLEVKEKLLRDYKARLKELNALYKDVIRK